MMTDRDEMALAMSQDCYRSATHGATQLPGPSAMVVHVGELLHLTS